MDAFYRLLIDDWMILLAARIGQRDENCEPELILIAQAAKLGRPGYVITEDSTMERLGNRLEAACATVHDNVVVSS